MSKSLRITLRLASVAGVAILLLPGCGRRPSTTAVTTIVPAPPGPADLGPATGLSTPPEGAIVFDLKYRPETGRAGDIPYSSFWGYGGNNQETKTNSFLQDVRKKASNLHYECNDNLAGRKWAAVEWHGREASAFYFDLNADGKLSDNERILPTRSSGQWVEFITPDFMQTMEEGGQTLCRVLLRVNFYDGDAKPNCMWSAAALMEGSAKFNNRDTRLLLFASEPGGVFNKFGRSYYSLSPASQPGPEPSRYVPRNTLSSLITSEGKFYHLKVEGSYSNGLPARVVLTKDTSPTGALAVKLVGSNSLEATFSSLNLSGAEDKTIVLHVGSSKEKVTLPVGAYVLDAGMISYGPSDRQDWEVSFTKGPRATVKADQVSEQTLGQPTLQVRAVKERERYNRKATESAAFKKGTRIYLEPRIVGRAGEIFSRFRQGPAARRNKSDRPPRITITGPDGKELLSKVMEYG